MTDGLTDDVLLNYANGSSQRRVMQILSNPQVAQGFVRVVFDMLIKNNK